MTATADALMAIFGFKRVEGKQMKTDRELLELAARAAGVLFFVDSRGRCMEMLANLTPCKWNPLTDDGDALRLAVKLNLVVNIDIDGALVEMQIKDDNAWASEFAHDGDLYAATRRAVVRAAAAIGEAKQ